MRRSTTVLTSPIPLASCLECGSFRTTFGRVRRPFALDAVHPSCEPGTGGDPNPLVMSEDSKGIVMRIDDRGPREYAARGLERRRAYAGQGRAAITSRGAVLLPLGMVCSPGTHRPPPYGVWAS
jgi:hypothetical protein